MAAPMPSKKHCRAKEQWDNLSLPELGITKYTCQLKPVEPVNMNLTKLKLEPLVTKSEPNTPVYATTSVPKEAPEEWFATISHKEKLAVFTIEHIPMMLDENFKDHKVSAPTDFFSPRLLSLLDRMKFHFSRAMALARCEAENGVFFWHEGLTVKGRRPDEPIRAGDVMTSLHVEAFLAGIEEIHHPEKDNRVVYRRYWRILAPPAGLREEQKLGGVVSSGSGMEHHIKGGIKQTVDKQWHTTPKQLIAEFTIGVNGHAVAGRTLGREGGLIPPNH